MKNFKTIIFTTIAISALIFPTACVHAPQKQKELPYPAELNLIRAAHDKDTDSAKRLVKQNISVNATESYAGRWEEPSDWTAAMWSVWHWFDDKPLCAYIMHSNGKFGQKQKDALLERAARTGDCERAKVFLELGANPNYVNAFGENCATLALRYFRGQYGIKENTAAAPRYAKLDDINAALKENIEENARAGTRFAETQKAADAFTAREKAFAQSPQASVDSAAEFEAKELPIAHEFYKKIKSLNPQENVPQNLGSAKAIYATLLEEVKTEKDTAEKNLQYVKFIKLLKNKGANLRKLLAGTQDNSGTQDNWKGQQDKWTMDAVARRGVHDAFPLVIDGMWDGELALIQLIGRGGDLFTQQILPYTLAVPKEYVFMQYILSEKAREAQTQGENAVRALYRQKADEARTTRWSATSGFAELGMGTKATNRYDRAYAEINMNGAISGGTVTVSDLPTKAEQKQAFELAWKKGLEDGNALAAIELILNGEKLFEEADSEIERKNTAARERNSMIYALYEEPPFEGELAEKWRGVWERRVKRRAEDKKFVADCISQVIDTEISILEKMLARPESAPADGIPFELRERLAEERYQENKKKLQAFKDFRNSDFLKELPVEDLIANPPHPRDVDPTWFAQNCLGKIKVSEIFVATAKALLDYGVDVNARANGTNHPALVCAYLWDKPEFEKLLLSYGADPKLALFHVCELNDFDLLKKMLPRYKSLADVPADALGNTILHRAVLAGRADVIPEIIKRGVPVNAQNKHDDTPLHLAAEKEDKDCAVALLNAKANVNATDKDGRKPVQRFWNIPSPELTKIFSDAQAKKN